MSNKCFLVFLAFLFSVSVYSQQGRHRSSLISGRVMSTEKEVVDFATVYLKGTNQGCYTDEKGIYHLKTTQSFPASADGRCREERALRGVVLFPYFSISLFCLQKYGIYLGYAILQCPGCSFCR